jgi:RNA recognition motif-containing protein
MVDFESAQKVMNALNNQNLDGKEIIIELAGEREQKRKTTRGNCRGERFKMWFWWW